MLLETNSAKWFSILLVRLFRHSSALFKFNELGYNCPFRING